MFEVGNTYENRIGKYEVLKIDGDKLYVRYADGKEGCGSVVLQERIIQNKKSEGLGFLKGSFFAKRRCSKSQRFYPNNQDCEFYKAIGRLATSCKGIWADFPPKDREKILSWYENATGDEEGTRLGHFFAEPDKICKDGVSPYKRGIALHIDLGDVDDYDYRTLGNNIDILPSKQIYNTNFCAFLVEKFGFHMKNGKQNISKIRENIPDEYKSDFDEGVKEAESK
jgi:hypothetical protein